LKITRMMRGQAPDSADRILIDRLPDGRVTWVGALDPGRVGNSLADFYSVEKAEADAICWAEKRGSTEVIIEADDA
jgi:hypothetical protein